ncbi:MAG: peptidylprolyl isomerase [Psychroserpens sp.]|nr:peptidylprolyl isomerase [Psychroserpens sp.]
MKQITAAICLCFSIIINAQVKDDDVLFTVDESPVLASEFIRVYNKNLDLVKDETQKDVDAYLELFINYQLKVKEARRLELDKEPKYVREFSNYKNQLTKNYLTDNKVTDVLVREAYDRSTSDIKASHILIRLDENATDTTMVYNQLLELRQRVQNEGFEVVQKQVHDGKEVFAENLGYFSAFKMVYPFESAAYNTKVGQISMPFRTRFGYHVVLVEDMRPSEGEVTVAHIMISNKQKDTLLDTKKRIYEIYKKLQQGEKFESLAKQFSDDKSTSSKGGVFSPFTRGQLGSEEFENVAFSLKDKGDVSEPFTTAFGWHIVKLLNKKGVQPFEEVQSLFESKVKRDSRSKLIKSAQLQKLKDKYSVELNEEALSYFTNEINDSFYNRAWVVPADMPKEKVFLSINEKTFTYNDYAQFLFKGQRAFAGKKVAPEVVVNSIYDEFLETQLFQFQKDNLENENQEFANVLKEYRDGLLLFDLMEKQVWNAASTDSVGLEAYYNKNKGNYMWKDRAEGTAISSADQKVIQNVLEALNSGTSVETIEQNMNDGNTQNVITTKGVFQSGDQNVPADLEFKAGISKVYQHNDAFHVFLIDKVMPATQKTLEEAKGKVISDFQNQIELDWMDSLNERYTVEIDKKVLKKVKSEILN